jgi:hypothetical protein
MSNHDLFRIIPNKGSQRRITLSLESFRTVPFQATASDVKIPEWGQHCSNHGMPCLVNIFGTFPRTGNQPNKTPGAHFRCTADIISNITDREIQRPGMLVARKICQVSLVGCTNDWHNLHSSRNQILRIPPPIAGDHLAVYSATCRDCKAHRLKIDVCLKWDMCQNEQYTFENIPVV